MQDPVELLRTLIRFDTTNPPGNEGDCIDFVWEHLTSCGIEAIRLTSDQGRKNLIGRLQGDGKAAPLLFYGHLDVVTTSHQTWTVPPFAARLEDGWIWGRGTLDMKGAVAMMIAAMARAPREGVRPAGDIVLALLSDEEAGGTEGARFLVEKHPEHFDGIRYAVGEFGGVPLHINGRRFYVIQVAEKQPCWLEAKITGPAGHGARPVRGGVMAMLGDILKRLDAWRSPVRVTDVTRRMVEGLAQHLPPVRRAILRRVLNPRLTDRVLPLLGETGRALEPLFRHTINATIVRGGDKANVIPNEITLGLDARILPGSALDDFLSELRPVLGHGVELEVLHHDPAPAGVDYGRFDDLGRILCELDPEAIPLPMLMPGSTDGRFFSRLGIQTYGFTPLDLPVGFDFFSTIHAADERVPASCLEFGTEAYSRLIASWRG